MMATRMPLVRAVRGALGAVRANAFEIILVLLVAGLVATIVTWPVAADFTRIITGPSGNDQLGYQQEFWFAAHHGLSLFRDGYQTIYGAPFGGIVPALPNLTLAATLVPATILTTFFSSIVAYNVLTLAGLALSGASMYLLVRWLGLGIGPAAWGGLAYMVFPYHLLAAQSWVTLVPYTCFPLLLIAVLSWVRRPTWANGVGSVLALALAAVTFPYFVVMGLFMVMVAVVVSYVRPARSVGWRPALLPPGLLILGVGLFVIAPLQIVARMNPAGTSGQGRDLNEVTRLGPVLSDYITPPRNSPIFNGIAGTDWYGIGSVGGERLTYIGAGALLLFALGLTLGLVWRRTLTPLQHALILTGPVMIVVLVVVSLRTPYPVGDALVTMPSRIIFEIAPYIRAFGRFVIAIAAIAIVVGALGLRLLMDRFGPIGRKALVAAAVVLTGAEAFFALPLITAEPTSLPENLNANNLPTWKWLARHGDGRIVFEQPETGNTSLQRVWMYGTTQHGYPVLNAVSPLGEPGSFISEVIGPPTTETARLLAAAGIGWVNINAWAYRSIQQKVPEHPPSGYRVAARFSDGSAVWQVTAPSRNGFATFKDMDTPRLEYGAHGWRNWRWMFSTGSVRAYVREPGTYRATFQAGARSTSAVLSARSPDGFQSSVRIARRGHTSLEIHAPSRQAVITLQVAPSAGPGQPTVEMTPWILTRVP